MIIPSTTITIAKNPLRREQAHKAADQPCVVLAPAAKLLLETVLCLRVGSTTPAVPKTFILSGPPGVGKLRISMSVWLGDVSLSR